MRIIVTLSDEEYDAVLLSLEHTLERAIARGRGTARGGGSHIGADEPLDLAETEASDYVWPSPANISTAIQKLVDARLDGHE